MTQSSQFYESLAKRRLGAGALITNFVGDALMVKPTYKPGWEIPGGAVEAGESAPAACVREVREELGLTVVEPGRLLVIDHQQDPLPRGDSIMFVYDLGGIEEPSTMQLNASELSDYAFVGADELADFALHRLARRVRAALAAKAENSMVELIDGERRA
ncbi:NUDIX hydrolase [Williamsia herbipolensis]|uniref:NUDIX hydrolase n=1 Tax=Williamsia herbipolensis TaxID=1603258 RepID=A0AAU4JYU8_9NOCA|nr:NUDIX hydrolase [Williamsia herbipolensis]